MCEIKFVPWYLICSITAQVIPIVSRRTKLYIHDGLGRGRVYAEIEMVYGKVYKQKLQKYTITTWLAHAR